MEFLLREPAAAILVEFNVIELNGRLLDIDGIGRFRSRGEPEYHRQKQTGQLQSGPARMSANPTGDPTDLADADRHP